MEYYKSEEEVQRDASLPPPVGWSGMPSKGGYYWVASEKYPACDIAWWDPVYLGVLTVFGTEWYSMEEFKRNHPKSLFNWADRPQKPDLNL